MTRDFSKCLSLAFLLVILLSPVSAMTASLKVGVTAGPHATIAEKVKDLAKEKGINLEVIEFNDFILPNIALSEGDLDLNSYQHLPFLEEQMASRNYHLKSLGKTVLMPLGIYSQHHKSLKDLQQGAIVAIPSDPTNEGRALKLLEREGLLTLKKTQNPSLLDIQDNPRKLRLVEIEAPQLPRTLEDVDAAVINTDWILVAGMNPKTALATERKDSPYTNVLVVRQEEKRPEIDTLLELYHSAPLKDFITKTFKGAVIPGW